MPNKPLHHPLVLHVAISAIKISVSIPILISTVMITSTSIIGMLRTISTRMWITIAIPEWTTLLGKISWRVIVYGTFNSRTLQGWLISKVTVWKRNGAITLYRSLACPGCIVWSWIRVSIIITLLLKCWICRSSALQLYQSIYWTTSKSLNKIFICQSIN